MPYFNTVPVAGTELAAAIKAADQQDQAVLALFASGGYWSPSEANRYFTACGKSWPLTSVRRSMSNLTKTGALKQTGLTIIGPYGRHEKVWSKA